MWTSRAIPAIPPQSHSFEQLTSLSPNLLIGHLVFKVVRDPRKIEHPLGKDVLVTSCWDELGDALRCWIRKHRRPSIRPGFRDCVWRLQMRNLTNQFFLQEEVTSCLPRESDKNVI